MRSTMTSKWFSLPLMTRKLPFQPALGHKGWGSVSFHCGLYLCQWEQPTLPEASQTKVVFFFETINFLSYSLFSICWLLPTELLCNFYLQNDQPLFVLLEIFELSAPPPTHTHCNLNGIKVTSELGFVFHCAVGQDPPLFSSENKKGEPNEHRLAWGTQADMTVPTCSPSTWET